LATGYFYRSVLVVSGIRIARTELPQIALPPAAYIGRAVYLVEGACVVVAGNDLFRAPAVKFRDFDWLAMAFLGQARAELANTVVAPTVDMTLCIEGTGMDCAGRNGDDARKGWYSHRDRPVFGRAVAELSRKV
jgi:hypothetical protein